MTSAEKRKTKRIFPSPGLISLQDPKSVDNFNYSPSPRKIVKQRPVWLKYKVKERNKFQSIAYDGTSLYNYKHAEQRLVLMIVALGQVVDQCEAPVRHADVSIRCWLRSQCADRPYKAPSDIVGREATLRRQRRLMKSCVCVYVCLWSLSDNVRQRLLKRTPTGSQRQALARV